MEIAARHAFWKLSRTQLVLIMAAQGVVFESGSSLCDVVFSSVKSMLKCRDEEAISICEQRLAINDLTRHWSSDILAVDEAAQVLERSDHELLGREQKDTVESMQQDREFVAAFRRKSFDVHALAKAKAGPKAKAKAAVKPKAVKLPACIPQAEAKKIVPADAYIWRGYSRAGWNGHYPPRRRVSATFQDHGEDGALRQVLKMLWLQFLDAKGLSQDWCPYPALFEE